MSEPRELTYDASGIRFAALAWGPEDGPLALCLHGYPDTAWTWRHLGPRLAAGGWRVVAPFMRGYAPTGLAPERAYGIGSLAADAQNAHAALGGDGRAALIGHDWGAAAAYAVAAATPDLFARVVTLSVPPPAAIAAAARSGRAPRLLRQGICSWYMGFHQLPFVAERAQTRLIPWLWSAWAPGYDGAQDASRALAALDGPGRRTAALGYYRALLQPRWRAREHHRQQRSAMRVPPRPLLYIHGADDGCMLGSWTECARAVLVPRSRVELMPGAGHFPQLEQPEHVGRLTAEFLAGA